MRDMTFRRSWAAGLLGLLGLLAMTSPVMAAQSRAETLVLVQNADTYETLGWRASGPGFVDAGSWTVDRLILGPPRVPLLADVETTQIGCAGSFQLAFHGGTTPVGSVAAQWRLYGGTGAYGQLKGTGVWTQAYVPADTSTGMPPLLVFTLTGSVH